MYSQLALRKARVEDLLALVDLTNQLGYPIAPSILAENVKAYLQDVDRLLLVAISRENVVGYIALDVAQTFHREEKHMRIVSLVVDRAHRGKGIGKLLLQAAEDWAKQKGCWVVEVTSSSHREKKGTHDFYISRGYLKNGSQAYFQKLTPS